MHFESSPPAAIDPEGGPWHRGLTKYHWFVLVVAALGWMFDTMDQQLFNLARRPAMDALLHTRDMEGVAASKLVSDYGSYATAIFMIGWALGGLGFGILGDRIGRARTMMWTILIYSIFTGLSAFSNGFWDFALYRFLTGLGVGGEFAVGVALVAEVFPDRARPHALGWLQACSAIGNMTAAVMAMGLGSLEKRGVGITPWRAMFIIGTLPALLAILIRRRLKEPEKWKAVARAEELVPGAEKKLGSVSELFGNPRWRKNAIVGMVLGFSGVVGLWGIGFFSFDLVRAVFKAQLVEQVPKLSKAAIDGELTWRVGLTSLFQNLGGFFGVYAFTKVTARMGRKPAFAISFLLAAAATAYTFWSFNAYHHIFWMIPLMGFCQLTLFGGYAIYFPELFPTRLRSTGTSFCYNVGRLVAAAGPLTLGAIQRGMIPEYGEINARRYAGVAMCAVFFIGLLALPFAPETKGKPLPE